MKKERPPLIHIHYLRPPDREKVYTQYLIHEEEGVKVTYAPDLSFESPKRIAGAVVLETGSEVPSRALGTISEFSIGPTDHSRVPTRTF